MKTVRQAIDEINKELENLNLCQGSAAYSIIMKAFEVPGTDFKLVPEGGYGITANVGINYVPIEGNLLYDKRFNQLKVPMVLLCPKKKRGKDGRFYLKEFEYWTGSILSEWDDIAAAGTKIEAPGQHGGLDAQTRNLKCALKLHELALNEEFSTYRLTELEHGLTEFRRRSMSYDCANLSDTEELPLLIERAKEIQAFQAKNGMLFDESLDVLVKQVRKTMAAFENPKSLTHDEHRLAGGYVLLKSYATRTDEESRALKDDEETPLATVAVKEDFLKDFIAETYDSVDAFLGEYTSEDSDEVETQAILDGAIAFEHRDGYDGAFQFFATNDPSAMLAYTDYLSRLMEEKGNMKAGCLLDEIVSQSEPFMSL